MTPPEAKLWLHLRRLRPQGLHFRRQAPFRGYYLDFACFKAKLVIELDGSQHADEAQAAHDGVRDAVLAREGFRVLRFWNQQVLDDVDAVVDGIWRTYAAAGPHPSGLRPSTLAGAALRVPTKGEGEA